MFQLFNTRREWLSDSSTWVHNGDLNEGLALLNQNADYYLVVHKLSDSSTANRVFEDFDEMAAQLEIDALAGDHLTIFTIDHGEEKASGIVPDLDGLIPIKTDQNE